MHQTKHSVFSKVLSSVLSAACVLSSAAFIGTAASTTANAASSEATPATFSWDNASVYFLLTDRFNNGNTSNDHSYNRGCDKNGNVVSNFDQSASFQGGDFAGITKKIEDGYFTDLGVNAIWMSAPYEQIHGYVIGGDGNPSFAHYSYHGYYVLDYTETDANFGTKEEFKKLVDTAHEHGIRIVLDIVMNHAGYQSLYDMNEYNFGPLKSGWEDYYFSYQNICNEKYHGYINYDKNDQNVVNAWAKWWGPNWIRCGLPGYTEGSGDIEMCLASLPDFKTGSNEKVGIPEFLKSKWTKEGTYDQKISKYGSSNTVTGYISDWLAEWVREYGVDGFRCDTAKHVELSAWKTLKEKCVAALKEWKSNNPTKKLDDLDFWMTGECFPHYVDKDSYYTQGGFDSMINFEFAPAAGSSNIPSADKVESYYSRYANSINNTEGFNVLSYISSHDTILAKGDRKYAGSMLLMLPGAIQIYYGDETERPVVSVPSDSTQGAGHMFRGFMNWDNMNKDCLNHWQKVGQFRNNHIAVGAGDHKMISAYDSTNGYTFARTYNKNGIQDTIVATLFATANKDITIDVSSVWSDGIEITNTYDGTTCKVSGGKVTFNSGSNGTILMQEPQGAKGKVTVKHINKTTGETIKTETMAGLIGDSYQTSPLAEISDYYTVDSVEGPTTGTYSENEATVTYYYVFDSQNNGTIKVSYVDASTGAEIADSDFKYGKIGTTYSVSPKTIKNYEVDESLTNNATGTVKSGTTNVVFKYNYVEPTNVMVHYYNSNNWSSVSMYVYDESDPNNVVEYAGKWPGQAMKAENDGWFYGEVDAETATFIANNAGAGAQDPSGVGTSGYNVTGEVWIKNGKVYPTGKVNVRYVSSDGKVLATETLKGMADGSTSYKTSAKTFDGYTLSETPSNATGIFSESAITVTYVYKSDTPRPTKLVNNSTISATTINLGSTVTLKGVASGGTAPYQYEYLYKKSSSSSWTTAKSYSSSTSATIKPAAATTYDVRINVKDSDGTVAKKDFTVNVKSVTTTLINKSTISATTIDLGSTVTLKGAASGGKAPYQYAYFYKRASSSSSSWTTVKGFSTTATATIKPAVATKYDVCIKVKDAKGTIARKYFTVNVTAPLTNKSTLSTELIYFGDKVVLKGAATGGTTPYKYAYFYKKASSSKWTTVKDYSTTTSVNIKPQAVTDYDVCIKVKDANGTVEKKYFTVNVW